MSKFLQIFLLNPNFLLAHRNRYSEGMENGQKTPRGHPNFNSYVKNLHVLVFRIDGPTDRQTKITPAARELEELFSAVLERFLQPIHALRVYCKN